MEHAELKYDVFCCPRCYKFTVIDSAKLQDRAKRCKCNPLFQDGITKITKDNCTPECRTVIDNLWMISKQLSRVWSPVKNDILFKNNGFSIYIFSENMSPKGYLATMPYKDTILVANFMTVEYKQNDGIEKKLFDFMIKDRNILPENLLFACMSRPVYENIGKLCEITDKMFVIPEQWLLLEKK